MRLAAPTAHEWANVSNALLQSHHARTPAVLTYHLGPPDGRPKPGDALYMDCIIKGHACTNAQKRGAKAAYTKLYQVQGPVQAGFWSTGTNVE